MITILKKLAMAAMVLEAILWQIAVPHAEAQVAFAPATNFTVSGSPSFVASGDFNSDGKSDLAVSNMTGQNVSILIGDGAGSFGTATNFSAGINPSSVSMGDFNSDGKPDLAVASWYSNTVSILPGDGTGSFGAPSDITVEGGPISVATGDFNSDGKPDLAVVNAFSNTVSILLGDGTGSFGTVTNFPVGTNPHFVTVGDFNSDGKLDLAVTNGGDNTVSILLGNGAGSFATATNFAVGDNPQSVAAADLNGDGKLDLVVANASSDNISVLLGNGFGSFSEASIFAVGGEPIFAALGDLDGDGKLDLAVTNAFSDTVSILLGDGSGSFGIPTNFLTGTSPESVAVGDFNDDGRPDLAVGNAGSDDVSVLLNTTPFSPSGTFGSATDFTVALSPSSVAIGDFDRDGMLDMAVANSSSDNISILLGDGTGSFGMPTNIAVGSGPVSITVGDFNGDGKPDLAAANYVGNTVSILLGDGAGSFGAATHLPVGGQPFSVAVGDFNRDGKLDLAVGVVTNTAQSDSVSIFLGDGTGSFGAATNFAVVLPVSVAVGDFNGDGKLDLAVVNNLNNGTVSILIGNGDGTFGTATSFAVGEAPFSVATGDFNRDGKLDLAVANQNTNNVSILLGNGTGFFSGPTNFAVGFYPRSVAIGDFNRDGKPDLAVANSNCCIVSILSGDGTGSFGSATNLVLGGQPFYVAVGDFNRDGKPDLAVLNGAGITVSVLFNSKTTTENQPPIAYDQSAATPENTEMAITLSATDVDSASLTFAIVSAPTHGTLSGIAILGCTPSGGGSTCSAKVTYTPNLNYNGQDTFTFTANDGVLDSNVATVSITVRATFNLSVDKAGSGRGLVISYPAGISCGATCSAPFNSGTVVTLRAFPRLGSEIAGFSGGCVSTTPTTCKTILNRNRTVTATFISVPTFTFSVSSDGTGGGTVTSSPAGINCGTTCTAIYNSGTIVTLSAAPDSSSILSGWSGACTGTGACTVTMDADKSVTATFTHVTQPDLIMTDITSNAATVNQGASLSVTDTVSNLGTASGAFRIAYHLSTDAIYGNGDDLAISTVRVVTSLAKGASSTGTTGLLIPSATPPGVYYVCARADSLKQVAEADEGNNTLCSSTQVTVPPPDLIVSSISTGATTVAKGHSFSISFTIENLGGSKAGGFLTGFHLSTDANYGGGDDIPVNQKLSLPSLGMGGSYGNGAFGLVVPSSTPQGTYFVCGMTDMNNTVAESEEGNNANCTGMAITVP